MQRCLPLDDVNNLPSEHFIKIFGNVVEHCPAAAIGILKFRPFACSEDIAKAISYYLDSLTDQESKDVLNLHPDLAGKLADLGKLTPESNEEQKSAGLDKLSTEDKHRLNSMNEEYKSKFGFPFIICAKENKATAILQGLEDRLLNSPEEELENGIVEVKKISRIRINDIVKEDDAM